MSRILFRHKVRLRNMDVLPQHLPCSYPQRHFSTADHRNLDAILFSLLDTSPSTRHLRHLHCRLIRTGLYGDVILSTKLVLAYSNHGSLLTHAYPVFLHMPVRNAYSWNIIIGEFSRAGHPNRALSLFLEMTRSRNAEDDDISVDAFTVPIVLRSCASARAARMGASVHGLCEKVALQGNVFVGSSLVFMYVAVGRIRDARGLFDGIPERDRDAVLWTTMLSGYAQSGETGAACNVFRDMVAMGVQLDAVVMVSMLLACSHGGWLHHGKTIHAWCLRRCKSMGLSLENAILDMYVKCGTLHYAQRLFYKMPHRDVISWSALILGNGLSGNFNFALELFDRMLLEPGVRPNLVTFLGVLSACTHAGMVDKAWHYWNVMKGQGLVPELKHYTCMVDVMGRAGQIVEAERFVEDMPVEPDEALWAALLGACRVYGNVEVGEKAAKRMLLLRPDKSGYYTLLANLYSDAGRFEEAEVVRNVMKGMSVGKVPGQSLVEPSSFCGRNHDLFQKPS